MSAIRSFLSPIWRKPIHQTVELNDSHARLIAEAWQEAIGRATCTAPADRQETENVIREIYRYSGAESEPPRFVWLTSPAACVVAAMTLGCDSQAVNVGWRDAQPFVRRILRRTTCLQQAGAVRRELHDLVLDLAKCDDPPAANKRKTQPDFPGPEGIQAVQWAASHSLIRLHDPGAHGGLLPRLPKRPRRPASRTFRQDDPRDTLLQILVDPGDLSRTVSAASDFRGTGPELLELADKLSVGVSQAVLRGLKSCHESAEAMLCPDAGSRSADGLPRPSRGQALSAILASGEHALSRAMYGQHDMYWVSLFDLSRRLGSGFCPDDELRIDLWLRLSRSAGWWFPYERVCFCSDRPVICELNDRQQPHNSNGPALAYSDGWSIWMIGGVPVSKQTVMAPETLTVQQIFNESNSDVRSIMLSRFGWLRFIQVVGVACLDERENPVEGTREAIYDFRDLTGANRLIASCATGRVIDLSVPHYVGTCQEAQAWLNHGLTSVGRT